MNLLRNTLVGILLAILFLLILWGEMSLILPHLNVFPSVLLVIGTIILWSLIVLYFINKALSPNLETQSNISNQNNIQKAASNNPTTIISKPLGGYNREQLNEIFLIGILIHQIYYSNAGNNLSEKQQRKVLSIQMRYFVTVYPQRNFREYFDFTEDFLNKNESLYNYSISDCIERSIQKLSSCNNSQIKKLQNLFSVLSNLYIEVGGGNKTTLTTFINLLNTELSGLTSDNWRSHYAQKKNH